MIWERVEIEKLSKVEKGECKEINLYFRTSYQVENDI